MARAAGFHAGSAASAGLAAAGVSASLLPREAGLGSRVSLIEPRAGH